MKVKLEGGYAPANANFQSPFADVIQHADLFRQTKRRIERQKVNKRSRMNLFRSLGHHAEIDAGCRTHIEW